MYASRQVDVQHASAYLRESQRPSVIHVLWSLGPGGAERAIYQLIREQQRRGYRADAVVANAPGAYGERLSDEGVTVHHLKQRHALDPRGVRKLEPLLGEYNLIHFHGLEPLLIRAAVARTDRGLFYTHRGGMRQYSARQRLRYALAAPAIRRFSGVSANTAQAAAAASYLFAIPRDQIPVTYNGLEFSLLEPLRSRDVVAAQLRLAPGRITIGTSGYFRAWKRVDRLLRAVAELKNEPVDCVVLGAGPMLAPLRRLADDLGIADRVTFVGHVDHIGDYLQILDIFVLPSGPEESFGNAVVEAMAMGVPAVIFSDGGGLREHVTDQVTGAVVDDEAELVERLRGLVHDEDIRRRLGAAAREEMRHKYSLDAMVANYERLYGIADGGGGATA